MNDDDEEEFPAGQCFELKPLRTIHNAVRKVRNNYSLKSLRTALSPASHVFISTDSTETKWTANTVFLVRCRSKNDNS